MPLDWVDLASVLDQPDPPADYLIEEGASRGLLERGTITILGAESGAGKSMVVGALAVAMTEGAMWLGRQVKPGRVLYIDGEMPARLAATRLRAFGLTSDGAARLRLACRPGITIMDSDDLRDLREAVAEHRTDLLILDTAMSLTEGLDPMDNGGVTALYSRRLGPIAADFDCAILITHHERKRDEKAERGASASAGALLGAQAWRARADSQWALEVEPDPSSVRHTIDGQVERYNVRMRFPKNRESGDRSKNEQVTIESLHDYESGSLRWMTVSTDREVPTPPNAAQRATWCRAVAHIVEAAGGTVTVDTIAEKLSTHPTAAQLCKGLAHMIGSGQLLQPTANVLALPTTKIGGV